MRRLTTHSLNQEGMTLMELLVAAMLVGVVMLGTVSVDFAIHSMRKTTIDGATVSMETSAAMLEITTVMAGVIGDAQNVGIVVDAAATKTWFCGREDTDGTGTVTANDMWICFWKPNVVNDPNIYRCSRNSANGPGACPTTNYPVVGTAACNVACASYAFTFSLTNNPAARQFYLDVTLKNRAYPLQQVNPAMPLKNPEYELSSRIAPIGHSYQ